MSYRFCKTAILLLGCAFSSLQAITPEAQMNQELLKLDQELSQRYLRRAFADMEPSKNWADLTFSYAPGVNNFPADASMYFSGPKLGYFAGVQVYNLQVANL